MRDFRSSAAWIHSTALVVLALLVTNAAWSASIGIDIDVVPTATTTGVLSIQRVELSFDNGLPEKTVAINAKLKARAAIRYSGNGALIGYWVVDGRPLQTFNTSLTFGDSIILETTDLPPLPTLEPGDHEVTLQLSVPAVGFTLPTIRYHVDTAATGTPLVLVQPSDGAILTRPRRDSLLVSGNTVTNNTSSNTLTFSWRPPVILPSGLALRSAAVSSYRFTIMPVGDPAQPLVDARVTDPWYALPAALATTLPTGQQLVWAVEALNARGAVLASSEQRQISFRSPSSIELRTPAEGEGISESDSLTWRSLRIFDHYEVRGYLNSTAMLDDLVTLARSSRGPTNAGTAVFTASTVKSTIALPRIDRNLAEPGLALYWVVIGRDRLGKIQDISEVGSFHLTSAIASLNGQPKSLLMAGFEIAVDNYRLDTPPGVYSGSGNVQFTRDRAQRDIPLDFTALNVEPYREQTRQTSGTGANQKTVISETLKGRVTAGRIAQTYTTPPVLDMQGYTVTLRALTLDAGVNGGAWADLTLALTGYRDGAGRTPAPLALPNVALETGGDFFAEVSGSSAATLTTTTPAVAGLTLAGGTLIADFSLSRDFSDSNGLPVARDAGIFLMGGTAKLDASTLFPVTAAQQIQLAYDAIELKPDGYDSAFTVMGSDDITPVVPADYRLHFTGGSLTIAHGSLQAASLSLDGMVQLPPSVRSSTGSIPTIKFTNMHKSGAALVAAAQTPDIEWGAVRGALFRLLNVSGELQLPSGTATDWQNAGLHLLRGTLDSPIRSKGEIGVTTPVTMSSLTASTPSSSTTTSTTTSAKPKSNSTASSSQNQIQSNITASQIQAALAGNQFDLRVRSGGISGTLNWSSEYEGKIGDFNASFSLASFTFVDNAVTDSRLDGELVVPAPANFRLGFTEATITGTGDIIGPKLVSPGEIALDYWHVKLVLQPAQSAANSNDLNQVQLALADSSVVSDAPLLLAAAAKTNAVTSQPTTPQPNRADVNIMLPASSTPVLVLSSSYLRINYPQLQFLLDPKYGPVEFDPLELTSIEIGADGQIRSSRLRQLYSRFLQMNYVADNTTAIVFEPYAGSTPTPGTALVTLNCNLTFPMLGERHVSLAHTVSGARADNLTPNSGGAGNPDYLRFDAANLVFHNAYAEGKGQYKEFLGTSQISALKTLYLDGLMMVGEDSKGVYESVGLGIGVDPVRAASLYASGVVSVGAKLGAGAVNLATGGKSTAETEIAKLFGSLAELATVSDPKEHSEKLMQSVADALALAKRINRDNGGKDDDDVGTLIGITGVALNTALPLTKGNDWNNDRLLRAVTEGLDLALGLVANLKHNGVPLPPDARNSIQLARVALKGLHAYLGDHKFSRDEWLDITGQLFAAADGFSSDRTYQLIIDLLQGTVEIARVNDPTGTQVPLKLASMTLKVLREANLLANPPEARDVLILSQAVLDGLLAAGDAPQPARSVQTATHVFEVASGDETYFGGGSTAEEIKKYLKLAQRTTEAVGVMAEGITYDKASRAVQATLHETAQINPPTYYTDIDSLVDAWVGVDQVSLSQTVYQLQHLLVCLGDSGCMASDLESVMASAVVAVEEATTALDEISALSRLTTIKDTVEVPEYITAFNSNRRIRVINAAQQHMSQLATLMNGPETTTAIQANDIVDMYKSMIALLDELQLPGNWSLNNLGGDKFAQLILQEIDRARNEPRYEDAIEHFREIKAMEERALSVGAVLPPIDITSVLDIGRVRQDLQNRIQNATTSDALREAVYYAHTIEREIDLVSPNSTSQQVLTSGLPEQEIDLLLQTEYQRALNLGRDAIEEVYEDARRSAATATRIEDVDEAVALLGLFDLPQVPSGYTPALRTEHKTTLQSLLTNKANLLLGEAEERMESLTGYERYNLASRYFTLKSTILDGRPSLSGYWASIAEDMSEESCAGWQNVRDRLTDPLWKKAPQHDVEIRQMLDDLYLRCQVSDEGDDPADLYSDEEKGAVKQFESLAKYLKALQARQDQGEPEALLKEELAWKLAARVKGLTSFFKNNPRDLTQATLGRVYHQTDYMMRFRQKSQPERIIAAIKLATDILKEIPAIDPVVRDQLQRVANGLTEFVRLGGTQRENVEMGIDFATGMAKAYAPPGPAQFAISMARTGLLEARKPESQNYNINVPQLVARMAAEGIRAAVEADNGAGWPPAAKSVVDLLGMLDALTEPEEPVTPIEQLAMAMAFVDKAGELPAIGRYIKAFVDPVSHLLDPDTDQQDYLTNVMLAELGEARNDNPAHVSLNFKSTCPAFSLEQGVQFNAPLSLDGGFVCAVDLAREAIVNNMKGAIDPNSPAGQLQNARTVTTGMRREAVFSRASGDDTLSGISGLLEYRNGQFSKFDIITTFGLAGQFETASHLAYSTETQLLTLEQASVDNRDAGLLADLGLSRPGTNMLFGTDFFQNPIKYLHVDIGGSAACFDMTLDLGLATPLGGWNTGRQGLATCVNPFSFDLRLNTFGNVLVFISTEGRYRLFFGNGTGGLEVGSTAGIYPTAFGYGVFLDAAVDGGLGAGATGIEICGHAAVRAGTTTPAKSAAECKGEFVPRDGGLCRSSVSIGDERRMGIDNNHFFLKAQTGLDFGIVYVGGWLYVGQNIDGGLLERFPTDRYGGWTGATSLDCGRLGI